MNVRELLHLSQITTRTLLLVYDNVAVDSFLTCFLHSWFDFDGIHICSWNIGLFFPPSNRLRLFLLELIFLNTFLCLCHCYWSQFRFTICMNTSSISENLTVVSWSTRFTSGFTKPDCMMKFSIKIYFIHFFKRSQWLVIESFCYSTYSFLAILLFSEMSVFEIQYEWNITIDILGLKYHSGYIWSPLDNDICLLCGYSCWSLSHVLPGEIICCAFVCASMGF